jgi:hypothetical protein
MNPLRGSSYSNLFSHYRPVGDPAWFTKPNPPDTPPPILDLDLAFQASAAASVTVTAEEEDASVCSSPAGGSSSLEERKRRWLQETLPHLSPTEIDPIRDGEDLFRYWRKVHGVTGGEGGERDV